MKRWLIPAAGLVLAGIGLFGYLLLTGPRMKNQPNIRPFQATFPPMPEGTQPVDIDPRNVPSRQDAETITNPLPDTPETVARGKTYYSYYCLACHGPNGTGDGPVGESYTPQPADLNKARIGTYSDGQLLRAMLTGVGHAPELERVVHAEHRWYLVAYLRSMHKNSPERSADGP